MAEAAATSSPYGMAFERGEGDALTLRLSGEWRLRHGLPTVDQVRAQLSGVRRLTFDAQGLGKWDSSLVTFLARLQEICDESKVEADPAGLPEGVRRLLALANAVPEKKDTGRGDKKRSGFVTRVGEQTLKDLQTAGEFIDFLGAATFALGRMLRGRAWFKPSDLYLTIEDSGARALPIITIISLLLGLILAFVGAVQLRQFGAQIFVADLVGIAMAREMSAVMTAIVMAGRTGAAFAAQLGTMRVNEEIDAFTTFGFSAMEFLVLPRMVALALMMPLLALYANLMGMVGGWLVGIGMLDLTTTAYVLRTIEAVSLTDFAIGLFKASFFGILVAIAGCLRGMQSGRSSAAVGMAATSAVVTSIVLIIVFDGIFAVLTEILGI